MGADTGAERASSERTDATAEGRPSPSGLRCTTRLAVQGTVVADTALRTAVASVLTVPMLTWALPGNMRRERGRLQLYRELAEAADPVATFRAPPAGVPVESRPVRRVAFQPQGARVEMLRFESPFEAANPDVRESYAGYAENHIAWGQRWCHDDGPHPTLCVVHGFGGSPFWLNSAFFALPWMFEQGYDVLLYVLPFHGSRQPKTVPFSGWGLFAHGFAHFNEAILHGVHDLRVFIDYLLASGVGQVGVTGLSLGGYTAALLASVEERISVSIPNAPVASMAGLIEQWFPASAVVRAGARVAGIDSQELESVLAVHSPLTYAPKLAKERRMIVGGLGDRLAPPEQSVMLWEHWDRCRLHWFPGNHIIHLGRRTYLREMVSFMQERGFHA